MTGLERLRLDRLMTVTKLAKEAKLAAGTIRRIEAGKPVHIKSLAALSTYFGVSASALVRPASELPAMPAPEPESEAA